MKSCALRLFLIRIKKISPLVMNAFYEEVSKRVCVLLPDAIVRVRQGSYTNIEMLDFSLDEDRRRLNDLLQNVWEDDSWQH